MSLGDGETIGRMLTYGLALGEPLKIMQHLEAFVGKLRNTMAYVHF